MDMYYLELCELECEKAEVMLESFEQYSELDAAAANLRAYVETGLDVFDEDAAQSTAEKKQGLIAKAWTALKNLIKSIQDKFSSIFGGKGSENALVAIPAAYADKKNLSMMQKISAKLKSVSKTTTGKVLMTIATAIAAVVAIFAAVKGGKAIKKALVTRKEARAVDALMRETLDASTLLCDNLGAAQATAAGAAAQFNPNGQPKPKTAAQFVDELWMKSCNKVRQETTTLVNTCKSVRTSVSSGVANAIDPATEKGRIRFTRLNPEDYEVISPDAKNVIGKVSGLIGQNSDNTLPAVRSGGKTINMGTSKSGATIKAGTAQSGPVIYGGGAVASNIRSDRIPQKGVAGLLDTNLDSNRPVVRQGGRTINMGTAQSENVIYAGGPQSTRPHTPHNIKVAATKNTNRIINGTGKYQGNLAKRSNPR